MWFKNLQIYKLTEWDLDWADFVAQLSRGPYAGCPSNQPTARGWVQPRQDSELVYAQDGQWLIALCTAERLLPSDVVNREVADRADALEADQGYRPGRKALRELKERVVQELLPLAFVRSRVTYAWIDRAAGYLVIDTPSLARAEAVIEHLRHCLDDFPLSILRTKFSPSSRMADWLAAEEAPFGFTIDQDCQLQTVGDQAAVTYSHHSLDGEEIREHLAAGKLPTKLAMTLDDRISFVLTQNLVIKRLAFLDIIKEQAEKDADTAHDVFDANFALMTGELRRFIPLLLDALGGESDD